MAFGLTHRQLGYDFCVLIYMSKRLLTLLLATFLLSCNYYGQSKLKSAPLTSKLKEGDIIFQSSTSGQSLAVQLATHSKYSHVGILFKRAGEWMVYEAVQPVKYTKLNSWIKHGDDNHYVVKRLKNTARLTKPVLEKMRAVTVKNLNKNYDIHFGWSDEKIYCSELVWKVYKRGADIEVGALQALGDFDLTHPIVKKKLKERYGNNIPWKEKVISPGAIFDCKLLTTVAQN